MQQALQVIAEHRIILWIIFGFGVSNILTSTLFHGRLVALVRRFYSSQFVADAEAQEPLIKRWREMGEALTDKLWVRIVGILLGAIAIAVSVAGLLLL